MQSTRRLAGLLILVIVLGACSAAPTATTAPAPSPDPDAPVGTNVPPDGGGSVPGDGGGRLVVPRPGQRDVHPIPATSFAATVDGTTIVVSATWTSGVEPCYVLDSIVVERGDGAFTVTLLEGSGPGDVACIEIAEQHRTRFDIPDVEPGTYVIRDGAGGAPDVEVVVG